MNVYRMVLFAFLGALYYAVQVALAPLPNIELVSVLILVTTLTFGVQTLFPVYVFIILEGLTYGFGVWWCVYLYVWPVLCVVVLLLQKHGSWWLWCAVLALFGLSFGFLCSIPYLFIGGPGMMFAWWVNGLPFDLMHCAGNLAAGIVLYKPLLFCLQKLKVIFRRKLEKQAL